MYCTQCGSKIGKDDNYCSNCGAKVKGTSQTSRTISRIDLLTGLKSLAEKFVKNNPQNKPALALDELVGVYSEDKAVRSGLFKNMPDDTTQFILGGGHKQLFTPTLNLEKLQKLDEHGQKQVANDNTLGAIDNLLADILIIGYLYRMQQSMRSFLDNKINRLELNVKNTPERAMEIIYDKAVEGGLASTMMGMFRDSGFGFPMLDVDDERPMERAMTFRKRPSCKKSLRS